jgi:outer membrane protein OmpA-like peptidoglycan-associated protein
MLKKQDSYFPKGKSTLKQKSKRILILLLHLMKAHI